MAFVSLILSLNLQDYFQLNCCWLMLLILFSDFNFYIFSLPTKSFTIEGNRNLESKVHIIQVAMFTLRSVQYHSRVNLLAFKFL